ncbi:MAG: hypothetical protein II282_02785 [Alistipes sp.]|nr:hypothetical protein [Alistipes sp.]
MNKTKDKRLLILLCYWLKHPRLLFKGCAINGTLSQQIQRIAFKEVVTTLNKKCRRWIVLERTAIAGIFLLEAVNAP